MKANELMIGDWVLTLDSTHKEKVFAQIDAIEEGKHSILVTREYSNWFVDIDWIEPISLTPEILEKNGFILNKPGQWVIEKKHSIGCCGQTCSSTNPLEYAVGWDEFGLGCVSYLEKEGNITLVGTTYVHQLQQILRLFNLDKFIKIELWKLNKIQ